MALAQIIKASLFTPFSNGRMGLPLLLEGEPGIGKSAIIEELCESNGLECETLTASDRDPTDFSGLPFPDKDHKRINRLVEEWMHRMFSWTRGVVFIDELSTVPGVVQAVLLRGIRSGVFASREAPKGVRFIAAMNPSEIASGGHKISQPLANRFGWLDFPPPTVDSWSEFMMRSGPDVTAEALDADEEEKRVFGLWPTAYAKNVGLMTAAVRSLPHTLFNKPKNNDPQASKAWSSPRTMEYATRAMAASEVHGLSEADSDTFMAAFVGEATALELIAFRNKQDLPDPAEVLDGNIKFKHDRKRIDRTWAVLSACTTLVTPTTCVNRDDRAGVMWEILEDVSDDASDLVAAPCRALLKSGLSKGQKRAFKVLGKIAPMLDAAGINWQGKND